MKKLIAITVTALAFVTGGAQAAVYQINSGNWDSVATWSTNATGAADPAVYDAGDSVPVATLGGTPGIVNWTIGDTGVPGEPGAQTGTYGGILETDGSGNVIAGTLVVTGTLAKSVVVAANSWWTIQYENMVINFGGFGTSATINCWKTALAPAPCAGAVASEPSSFVPSAGNEGAAGAARAAATFDGTTLDIFVEGYAGVSGTDYAHVFTLSSSVIPVPAAVWLFGSALGLLGWSRRKA